MAKISTKTEVARKSRQISESGKSRISKNHEDFMDLHNSAYWLSTHVDNMCDKTSMGAYTWEQMHGIIEESMVEIQEDLDEFIQAKNKIEEGYIIKSKARKSRTGAQRSARGRNQVGKGRSRAEIAEDYNSKLDSLKNKLSMIDNQVLNLPHIIIEDDGSSPDDISFYNGLKDVVVIARDMVSDISNHELFEMVEACTAIARPDFFFKSKSNKSKVKVKKWYANDMPNEHIESRGDYDIIYIGDEDDEFYEHYVIIGPDGEIRNWFWDEEDAHDYIWNIDMSDDDEYEASASRKARKSRARKSSVRKMTDDQAEELYYRLEDHIRDVSNLARNYYIEVDSDIDEADLGQDDNTFTTAVSAHTQFGNDFTLSITAYADRRDYSYEVFDEQQGRVIGTVMDAIEAFELMDGGMEDYEASASKKARKSRVHKGDRYWLPAMYGGHEFAIAVDGKMYDIEEEIEQSYPTSWNAIMNVGWNFESRTQPQGMKAFTPEQDEELYEYLTEEVGVVLKSRARKSIHGVKNLKTNKSRQAVRKNTPGVRKNIRKGADSRNRRPVVKSRLPKMKKAGWRSKIGQLGREPIGDDAVFYYDLDGGDNIRVWDMTPEWTAENLSTIDVDAGVETLGDYQEYVIDELPDRYLDAIYGTASRVQEAMKSKTRKVDESSIEPKGEPEMDDHSVEVIPEDELPDIDDLIDQFRGKDAPENDDITSVGIEGAEEVEEDVNGDTGANKPVEGIEHITVKE